MTNCLQSRKKYLRTVIPRYVTATPVGAAIAVPIAVIAHAVGLRHTVLDATKIGKAVYTGIVSHGLRRDQRRLRKKNTS